MNGRSHIQGNGPSSVHDRIVMLVAVIRAVPPTQVAIATSPAGSFVGGVGVWRGFVVVGGAEMRFALGANPEAALEALFEVLVGDARKQHAALGSLLQTIDAARAVEKEPEKPVKPEIKVLAEEPEPPKRKRSWRDAPERDED